MPIFERLFAQKVVISSHFMELQHCHFRAKITLFRPKWLKMVFFYANSSIFVYSDPNIVKLSWKSWIKVHFYSKKAISGPFWGPQKIAQKWLKSKKIIIFNFTQKNHGVPKMSNFHWKTNSLRDIELGEEYPSGPLLGGYLISNRYPTGFFLISCKITIG